MELVCSLTHKKPVCDRCNAGTNCTKCHANHELEVVQGSRMNLRLHIGSILKGCGVSESILHVAQMYLLGWRLRIAVDEEDSPAQSKEKVQAHSLSPQPWGKVGTDLFEYKWKDYLVVVDYLSDFFEVSELSQLSAAAVIRVLRSILQDMEFLS